MPEAGGVPYDYDEIWDTVYGDIQAHGPVHRHSRRIQRRLLRPLEYRSVLDIGCGPAINYTMLTDGKAVDRFTGLDISPKALESARRLAPSAEFLDGDIQVGHPEGQWDLVSCSYVMEHLPDDRAALTHMREVTGRFLLIATIAGRFDRHRSWEERVGHVRNYRPGQLEALLAETGFRVRRSVYWGYPFYSPLVRSIQDRSAFGLGAYTAVTRLAAEATWALYWLNSSRRGDVVIVLAEPA